jgi:hypothetical protein
MTRSEALIKLLALGPLSKPEIWRVMGGCLLTLNDAFFDLIAAGQITWRNGGGNGHQMWMLTPAARAALGGAHA